MFDSDGQDSINIHKTNNHLSQWNTNITRNSAPELRPAQKCDDVKPVNRIPALDYWISNDHAMINNEYKNMRMDDAQETGSSLLDVHTVKI